MTQQPSPADDPQWIKLRSQLRDLRAQSPRSSLRDIAARIPAPKDSTGVSHTTVGKVFSGDTMPGQGAVLRVVRALGGRTDDFLWFWDETPSLSPADSPLVPADLSGEAVLPLAADDRWIPRRLLRSQADARGDEAAGWRLQSREIMRSLIAARTIVVNRSYLIRNPVLFHGFTDSRLNRDAFVGLLAARVIVPFLLKERTLLEGEFAESPDAAEAMDIWNEILEPAEVKYLRLSWDEAENTRRIDLVGTEFTRRVREAADSLDLPLFLADVRTGGRDATALKAVLKGIVNARTSTGRLPIKRGALYDRYIDRPGGKTAGLQFRQPHMAALKWLFDLVYNSNLATATGLPLLPAADSAHESVVYPSRGVPGQRRPSDRATAAGGGESEAHDRTRSATLGMIQNALFLRDRASGRYAAFHGLELKDVADIRRTDAWTDYMGTVEGLVDHPWMLTHPHHGMLSVFSRYDKVMEHLDGIRGRSVRA